MIDFLYPIEILQLNMLKIVINTKFFKVFCLKFEIFPGFFPKLLKIQVFPGLFALIFKFQVFPGKVVTLLIIRCI